MSNNIYVKLDKAGVRSFLQNDVVSMLESEGERIASTMGDAEVETYIGKNRAFVNVRSSKTENNELLKAMR